jgi:hypothetical protein
VAAYFTEINKILKSMNNKLSVGGIFCDLKKTFDCVNHGILVDKLEFYGINGKFLTLIQSYLKDTKTYSLIKLMHMIMFILDGKVTNGAPQGLILGPSLFVIYINDLPKMTNNDTEVVLSADVTSIIVTNSSQGELQTASNKTLSDIISWFKANFQSLNFNKTYYLQF